MIPLCTPTTSDSTVPEPERVQLPETCGCAFVWLGSPCVAQRVCPIPQVPFSALPLSVFSIRLDRRPFAFTTCARSSPSRTASPAESYPLYSSLDRPSSRIGAACRFPVKPTIPHIGLSLPLFNLLYFPFYAKRLRELPESSLTLCLISLFADYIDHFVNIFLADAVVRCFDHKLVACYTPQRDM